MSGWKERFHTDRQQVGVNRGDSKRELPDEAQETVDSLLRAVAHVRSPDPRSLPTIDVPDGPGGDDSVSIHTPLLLPKVGDVIDERYVVESVLGMGGMGVVYAARNLRTDKEVAIKYLRRLEGSKRQREDRASRFVREAKAAGRIRHVNVVDIYDVHGDQTPYLVMERLHGESLGQRMKRGPLPPGEALNMVLGAMRGVAEAHKQGVVHRDLKPDNIFLVRTTEHSPPLPKVLDFGVSRLVEREGEESRLTTITRTGYVIGTPVYMPLEQLRGESNVDARADIYALGVLLYEALSGKRPYHAKNDQELLIKLATEAPTPLAAHLPSVDPGLDALIAKALAREPADRYPDVESFMRAIESWLATPYDASHARLGPRPVVRKGLWVLVMLALLLGALAVRWRGASPPESKRPNSQGNGASVNLHAAPIDPEPRGPISLEAGGPDRLADPPPSAMLSPPPPASPRPSEGAAAKPVLTRPARSSKQPVDRATTILPSDF